MTFTLYGVPILLAAGTTAQYAQFGGYPTGNGYGQMAGYMGGLGGNIGFGGFGGYEGGYGGGYGGNYGRQCRSNVRSEDLQGGFQQCYCDKNHRDEDPCSGGYDDWNTATAPRRLLGSTEPECQKTIFNDYYDDIFDEDCVQRWQRPSNVRRCQAKTKSKDLAGPAVCWCDSNHQKDYDDAEDAIEECVDYGSQCAGFMYGEDDAVGFHYSMKPSVLADAIALQCDCDDNTSLEQDMEDELEAYDPNCVERFGGYGGYGQQYGGYGGYGQQYGGYGQQQMYGGFGGQFGGQFGGNMFYPTSMQPAAAAPVDGAAPTFQFQQQYYGGYPQQQGYYGR